jgi:flagellar assembly protein FliH
MKDPTRDVNRIPKEQLTAYERWELPLLDARGNEVAREEEREVKPLTAADIDEIRQAAQEDGYKEGRDRGYEDGLKAGKEEGHREGLEAGLEEGKEQGKTRGYDDTRKEIDTKLDRLEHLLSELLQPIKRHEDELETSLVNLTTVLARAVVYRELTIDSAQIRQVVRRAMQALPSTAENIRIHINPEDGEMVREVAARLEATASVIEDASILPGGCKVETRHSLVDFTVEKRFQRAVQSMLDQQMSDSEVGETEELDSMMEDLTGFHRDVLDSGESGDPEDDPKPAQSGDDVDDLDTR